MTTMNIGEEGFFWFVGTVENTNDPMKMGRLQVRIHNIHSDKKTILPTQNIPWAVPLMPITSASNRGVGVSPTGIEVGSTVFGFFMDGRSSQNPVIMGTFPGVPDNKVDNHDVAPEAREINKVIKTPIGPEPSSPYGAKYPHNKVLRTKSGHVIEIDDTAGKERIHIFHKSGSYIEIDNTGRLVTKAAGDQYEIDAKNKILHVEGNVTMSVKGNVTATVDGSTLWKCPQSTFDGNVTVTGHTTIQKGLSVTGSSGGAAASVIGNMTIDGTITSSGDMTAPAFHGVADKALDGLDN